MALELRKNVVQAGRGDIHLIERLHGGEPRSAAAVGLALLFRPRAAGHDCQPALRRRLSPTSATAARAASPPLSPSSRRAPAPARAGRRAHALSSWGGLDPSGSGPKQENQRYGTIRAMPSPAHSTLLRRAVMLVAAVSLGDFGGEVALATGSGAVSLFADSIDFLE